MDNYYLVKVKS